MPAQAEKHGNVACITLCCFLPTCGVTQTIAGLLTAGASAENYIVMKKFEKVRQMEAQAGTAVVPGGKVGARGGSEIWA